MGKKIFKEEDINRMINMYQSEFRSVASIAKEYSVDSSVIKRILNENGITIVNGSAFSVEYWVKRGMSREESKKKVNESKPCLIDYWKSKGYSEEESKFQVELHLMNTERAFVHKFGGEGSKMFLEQKIKQGVENSRRKKEYWIKRGFSEDEALLGIKKSQSTFSEKKLTEKYGEIIGKNKLKERNEKWQNSLKSNPKYNEFQKKKDSSSINYFLKKYGDNFYYPYLKRFLNFDENIILDFVRILEEKNYLEFLKVIKENMNYDMDKINEISIKNIFSYVFKKSSDEIKKDIIKQYPIRNKNTWGTTYMIDGVIVRSLGEMRIYQSLLDMGIEFRYDKSYPHQITTDYRYDFYLPAYDTYIEYAGMENIRKTNKTMKIHEAYDSRILKKKEHCITYELKYFFSNSVEEIVTFIKNLYDKRY